MVERDGTLIMVDDERMPLGAGEEPEMRTRALPHAGLLSADRRHRVDGRHAARDHPGDAAGQRRPSARAASSTTTRPASMEKKKQEGYF